MVSRQTPERFRFSLLHRVAERLGFTLALFGPSIPLQCKHLLAVRLAERLNKFVDRTRTEEELLAAAFSALGH